MIQKSQLKQFVIDNRNYIIMISIDSKSYSVNILCKKEDVILEPNKLGISESNKIVYCKVQFHFKDLVGGKDEQKILPIPDQMSVQSVNTSEKWNEKYKNCMVRLLLEFESRSQIWVYFKTKDQCNQIFAKIASLKNISYKYSFNGSVKIFKERIRNSLLRKILPLIRQKKSKQSPLSQQQVLRKISSELSDKQSILQLFFIIQTKIKNNSKKSKQFSINLINLVSQRQNIGGGQIKLWLKGEVIWRIQILNEHQKLPNNVKQYQCGHFSILQLKEIQYKTVINFEFEHSELGRYTSQRFNLFELRKRGFKSQIGIIMHQGSKNIILKACFNFSNEFQTTKNPKHITPIYYPIINQIYTLHTNLIPQLPKQLSLFHQHNLAVYNQIVSFGKPINFYSFRKLFDLLKIEEILNKLYMNNPFSEYIMVENRGDFIYKHFVSRSQKYLYYDVESLLWKYPQYNRRLLSAIKCFDENPRINFTEPFGHLTNKILQLCRNLTYQKWLHGTFEPNIYGVQAMAFFLVLAVLKNASSLLIHNPYMKRSLQYDSLLFHYTLKISMPKIYNPIVATQINIQAFFGSEYLSIFARILPIDLFQYVLELYATQVQNNSKTALKEQANYNFTLIGTFLAMLEITIGSQSAFISCQHYLIFISQYFKNIPIPANYALRLMIPNKIELVKQCSNYSDFIQLRKSIDYFYQNQQSLEVSIKSLSQLSDHLYQQFMCYKHKIEGDLRKIFIVIDKIEIGSIVQKMNLKIAIYQKKDKLYEHQFKRINIEQFHHPIQLKILKLQEIMICISEEGSLTTYNCRIDPKIIPSNYYFHQVSELIPSRREVYRKMYMCYQFYIKDSTEIQFLENNICEKYINMLYLSQKQTHLNLTLTNSKAFTSQVNKEDVIYCNTYNKMFRMRQSNLNIIYSKLCWYSNHYLIPDQKMIDCRVASLNFDQKNSAQSSKIKQFSQITRYTRCVYGKAIIPYPLKDNFKIYTTFQMNNIIVDYMPQIVRDSNTIQYDTASGLTTYVLSNFSLDPTISFLQFFIKTSNLPLMKYLTYQPHQHFLLPIIKLQLSYSKGLCSLLFNTHGREFKTEFTESEAEAIQAQAEKFQTLPSTIQFQYMTQNINLDNYLILLRLNILQLAIEKAQQPKRWPNILKITNATLSNLDLYSFYTSLIQTKIILNIEFAQNTMHFKSSIHYLKHYCHFCNLNGKWVQVAVISLIRSPSLTYYYIQQKVNRRKLLMQQHDVILNQSIQQKNLFMLLQFTDKQLMQMRECVIHEINKLG